MITAWRNPARRAATSHPGAETTRWGEAGVAPPETPRPSGSCGTDLLQRGAAWLADRLKAHASQPVVYKTPAGQVEVCATFGRQLLKLDDGMGGVRMEWTDRDFVIPAGGFTVGGSPVTPARGHLVYTVVAGRLQTFEVFAYGGEPPWRWCDPYHTLMRVHTKLVAEEDA